MAAEANLADGRLVLSGELDRAAASVLWAQLGAHAGSIVHIDLQAVTAVDSAGLALLSSLASPALQLAGKPAGLDELVAAYRLSPHLGFTSSLSPVV